MKSKLLLWAFVFGASTIVAQTNSLSPSLKNTKASKNPVMQRVNTSIENNDVVPVGGISHSINLTDTLYYNDFSDSASFVFGGSPEDAWVWGTESTIGSGWFGPFMSPTASNGYAMIDSDGYGEGASQNSYIQTPEIDLTMATGDIAISFQQAYARFTDESSILVSTDGGMNFVTVGDNNDIPVTNAGSSNPTDNPSLKTILIPEYAGSSIIIRFLFVGSWDYTWLIDDLTVQQAEIDSYELAIDQIEFSNIITQYTYTQTPLTQADSTAFTLYVANNGGEAQAYSVDYEVFLGGSSVFTGSEMITEELGSFSVDTLYITTDFVPTEIGNYTIEVTLTSENEDSDPSNNNADTGFEITEYIWSPISSFNSNEAITYSGAGPAGEYIPYKVGQSFFVLNEQLLTGIDIGIFRITPFTEPQNFIVQLFEIDPTTGRPSGEFITLEDYQMEDSHSNTQYVTIEITDPVLVQPGVTYVASVGYEDVDRRFGFNMVEDGDLDVGTWMYGPFGANDEVNWWVGWGFSPAIRLNFDPTVGIENSIENAQSLKVSPNPASNNVRISTDLVKAEAYSISLFDINGRNVYSQSFNASGTKIKETISLEGFADGVYSLQLVTESAISTTKIVVAH